MSGEQVVFVFDFVFRERVKWFTGLPHHFDIFMFIHRGEEALIGFSVTGSSYLELGPKEVFDAETDSGCFLMALSPDDEVKIGKLGDPGLDRVEYSFLPSVELIQSSVVIVGINLILLWYKICAQTQSNQLQKTRN